VCQKNRPPDNRDVKDRKGGTNIDKKIIMNSAIKHEEMEPERSLIRRRRYE